MKRILSLAILLTGCLLAWRAGTSQAQQDWGPSFPVVPGQSWTGLGNLFEREMLRAELERASIGLALSPVPISAGIGRTRVQIGVGSYLVNKACVICHTNPTYQPGGDPFQGQPAKVNAANYLAGGVTFGPFTSRNLTPDPQKNNLPGGLTLEEFKNAMRKGEDKAQLHPQFGPLLQVMPWPEYSHLTDYDLEAMYAYLRVIPHAEPGK